MKRSLALIFLFLFTMLVISESSFAWDSKGYKKPPLNEIKKKLSELQFAVTQKDSTEPPFKNEYHDNKRDGIYVDIVSGEPLFSSKDKYDSGTGWPSFSRPLVKENLVEKEDNTLFSKRIEVRSRFGDSHLGHVFNDGPKPTGLRYCMNSAALEFIPAENLISSGYGEFAGLFGAASAASVTSTATGDATRATVVLAGGCFWCMEPPFESLASKGVMSVVSGYSGGKKLNPTYEEVSSGSTGHIEVVEVTYNPQKIKLSELLDVFWRNIDPFDGAGQFCDKGEQYTSAIFVENAEEREIAEQSLKAIGEKLKAKGMKSAIATKILDEFKFWPAEDYHQDYYKKNPVRYKFYRLNCGRDKRLKEVWGK